jgi:hypothetical protein
VVGTLAGCIFGDAIHRDGWLANALLGPRCEDEKEVDRILMD